MYVLICIKRPVCMLCINNSKSFQVLQSCEHNYRDIQHTPLIKKKKVKQTNKKQEINPNPRKHQNSVTAVVPGTIF